MFCTQEELIEAWLKGWPNWPQGTPTFAKSVGESARFARDLSSGFLPP